MESSAVRGCAQDVFDKLRGFVGPTRMGPVTLTLLVEVLRLIEVFTKNNSNFNFPVHVSGYDTTGQIFWMPVFEDPHVLESHARKVLCMLYRYVESAHCLKAVAEPLLAVRGAPSDATGNLSVAAGNPLLPSDPLTGLESDNVGIADGEGAVTPEGTGDADADALARAQAAAAAVVDAAESGEGVGANGTAGAAARLNAAAAPSSTASAARALPAGALEGANARMAMAQAAGGSGGEDTDSSSSGSSSDERRGKRRRRVGEPKRRRWSPEAPIQEFQPADNIPTDASKELLKTMFDSSTDRLTRLRVALTKGNAALAEGMSTRRLRLCIPWWPRQRTHDVPWPRGVIVDTSLLVAARAKGASKITAATVRAVLPKATLKRNSTVAQRVAEFLLLAGMSQKAHLAMSKYVNGFAPTLLLSSSGRAPPLGTLSGLRAVPRIAPTPAQFLKQQADPRRPGDKFTGGPSRPTGWVAAGSQPPTHQSRQPPEELPAPLPPTHPAAIRAAAAGATTRTVAPPAGGPT